MDTAARIEAARERLDQNRALLLRAKEAGPACAGCCYFIPRPAAVLGPKVKPIGPFCSHPAYSEQRFSVLDGKVAEEVHVLAEEARSESGLCGFEAVLFEPKEHPLSLRRKVVRNAVSGVAFTFLWLMSGLIFWEIVAR